MEGVRPLVAAVAAGGLWPELASSASAKCAEGSGSTPPQTNALFLLGQLSSLTDETAVSSL